MAGSGRMRSRDLRQSVYGNIVVYSPFFSDTQVSQLEGAIESCNDVVGNREGANLFLLTRDIYTRAFLSGTLYNTQGNKIKTLYTVPVAYLPLIQPDSLLYWPADDLSALKLEVQARSNPSVPSVSIPTFIGELKDVPDLVRSWGRSWLAKASNGNLWWRFGVKPLLGDLSRIYNFQGAVQQRLRMLRNLRDFKSVHRRVQLEHSRQEGVPTRKLIHSQGAIVYAKECLSHVKDMWGTCKWVLDPAVSLPQGDGKLLNLAKRLTLGLTTYEAVATLWELLPWSWLVDWFAHLGEFISACNNSLPLRCTEVCIMRTYNSVALYGDFDLGSNPWVRITGTHQSEHTIKRRDAMDGTVVLPVPSIPALTAGQWSILGSLAALKGLKVR